MLNPITIAFHTRPDFVVVESPDATLFAPFEGKKTVPRRSQSMARIQWQNVSEEINF